MQLQSRAEVNSIEEVSRIVMFSRERPFFRT